MVITAAMRPANHPHPDGLLNLTAAVRVALSRPARGRGVQVVMAGRILPGAAVNKGHTTHTDAFRAPAGEPVGRLLGPWVRHSTQTSRTLGSGGAFAHYGSIHGGELPRVDLLTMVPDVDPLQLVAAIQGGARGLVLAGYGNGTLPKVVLEGIRALRTTGNHLPIARSSRVAAGAVTADGEIEDAAYGTLATGALGARRARLLLHLCTATTANAEEAMARFRELLELEARHPPKGRANGRTDRTPRAA